MLNIASHSLLLVVLLGVAIFSSSVFVMLPPSVVSNQQQQQSAFATFPGENGLIAFSASPDSQTVLGIYVMRSDGTGQIRINAEDGYGTLSSGPVWSPDGSKIAFSRQDASTVGNIQVMDYDGSNQMALTNYPIDSYVYNTMGSWSPDGSKIVFTSNRVGSQSDILVTYNVTAEDNVDGTATLEEDGTTITQDDVGGNITISCEPPSGSEFPIGNTEVQCTATDEAGNVGGPESFTVTINPPPPPPPPEPLTAEISSTSTEALAPATLEFVSTVTGGTEPYTYSWDFGDGSEESDEQSIVHTYNEPGTYTVTLRVTDARQQSTTDNLEITVNERPLADGTTPPELTAEIGSDATEGVAPAEFEFDATIAGGTEPYEISWDFNSDGTEDSNEQSVEYLYNEPGTYNVVLTVTDNNGQTASDSVEVRV